MSAIDDIVLIERAQKGDMQAFDSLVSRYETKAYQYAFRMTRNQDVAADIVSDAFVRVFNALKNFRGQSAFGTWLYRILTNCYLDRKKRDRDKATVSLDQPSGPSGEMERQIEDDAPGPDDLAEQDARETTVQAALQKLPEYQQAMLVMFHVEMLSYEEIAAALDLPIGTVKSRLNRARVALREQLAPNEELFQIN
jgi:RNA polymerase sigma-70 factor (ECF subfamily)